MQMEGLCALLVRPVVLSVILSGSGQVFFACLCLKALLALPLSCWNRLASENLITLLVLLILGKYGSWCAQPLLLKLSTVRTGSGKDYSGSLNLTALLSVPFLLLGKSCCLLFGRFEFSIGMGQGLLHGCMKSSSTWFSSACIHGCFNCFQL